MPRDTFVAIIDQQLYPLLAFIILEHFMVWTVMVKLGFRILDLRIDFKQVLPGAFSLTVYSIFNKLIFPPLLSFLGLMVLFLLIFKARARGSSLVKIAWATFLTYLLMCLGVLILGSLVYLNKDAAYFLLKNPYGNLVGSFIEVLFPAIALITLSKVHISLIPPFKAKFSKYDLISTITFGALISTVYSSIIRLLTNIPNSPVYNFINLVYEWIVAIAAVSGAYLIYMNTIKTRKSEHRLFEMERQRFETEKNNFEAKVNNLDQKIEQLKDEKIKPRELVDSFKKTLLDMRDTGQFILEQISPDPDPEIRSQFSDEELKIITMITQGKGNAEIGKALYLDDGTIGNTLTKIYKRTGLRDRMQLAVFAIASNLVKKEQVDYLKDI
jgi:DNA-binding CsgD family transcriptional regulator